MRLKVLNLQKPVAFYLKLIILCWLDPSLVYVAICMLCFLHHRHLSLHQSISTISTQSVEQCSVFRPCFTMFVFLAWFPFTSSIVPNEMISGNDNRRSTGLPPEQMEPVSKEIWREKPAEDIIPAQF